MSTTRAAAPQLEALMAHAGWARALARRLVRDPDVAEDLFQDTLVASWKHPPRLDEPLRPWIATVLRNLARTRHRGAARAARREAAVEVPAAVASPEESLGTLEAQRALAEAVGRLAEPYRYTVILRYLDGLSAAEIGRAQGVPEGTVRWRLKTGLDQLRQAYRDERGADWRRALLPLAGVPRPRLARATRAMAVALGMVTLVAGTAMVVTARDHTPRAVSAVPLDPQAVPRLAAVTAATGTIVGTVMGPDGVPGAGAFVVAGRQPPITVAGDGRFRLDEVPAGRQVVAASGSAGLPVREEVDVVVGRTVTVVLRLGAGGAVLSGQVLDGSAGVIPGARLQAQLDGGGPPAAVLADDHGRYGVRLAPGGYRLTVTAPGYARGSAHVDLAGNQVRDFFLQPAAALAGRVLDGESERGVADAFVRAEPLGGGQPTDGRSDGDGRFELRALEPGQYRVFARRQSRVGFAGEPFTLASASRVEGVTVRLAPSHSISGRVLDPRGQPAAGAQVGMEEARGAGFGFRDKSIRATADERGRYRFEGVAAGLYHLTAHARPFGDPDDVTVGVQDADRVAPDLRLAPAARVAGRVLAADGAPVAGATIQLEVRAADEGNAAVRGRTRVRSDHDGRFAADDVGAGWLTATARRLHPPEVATVAIGLEPGATREIELRFAPPSFVAGCVRWADGSPASAVHVVWDHEPRAVTDAAGRYRLGPVPAGPGSVHAERPGANAFVTSSELEPSERRIEVRPGETVEGVDLVLLRGDRSVAGVVLGSDGAPVAGAVVSARPTGDTPDRAFTETRVVSGPDGAFTIPALTDGAHLVTAREPHFPDAEVVVDAGSRTARIRFAPALRVAGTIADGSGRPVAVATVAVVPAERVGRTSLTFGTEEGTSRRVENREGRFSVSPLATGTYDLLVTTPDGRAGRWPGIALRPGASRDDLRVVVGPGLTVKGRVLAFGTDAPVAQATVGVAGAGAHVEARTDSAGVFVLERQVPGRVLYLDVSGPGRATGGTWPVALPEGETTLELPPVRLVRLTRWPSLLPGIRFSDELGPQRVLEVRADSPFAAAGVKPGDVLRTLGGHPASGVHATAMLAAAAGEALFVSPEGTVRRVPLPPTP
jgi:RNA polymerase sigma factor (sigma-70 family)